MLSAMVCDRCGQDLDAGEHGWLKCPLEPRAWTVAVIDDQLEGGPRRFETMGDDAPFIESKSQWRREVALRNLEHVNRHDRDHHRRQFRRHDEELRDTGRNVEF